MCLLPQEWLCPVTGMCLCRLSNDFGYADLSKLTVIFKAGDPSVKSKMKTNFISPRFSRDEKVSTRVTLALLIGYSVAKNHNMGRASPFS